MTTRPETGGRGERKRRRGDAGTRREEPRTQNSALSTPRRSPRRGQSVVEFALVLPFFLALTFGVVDLGMGLYANNTIAGVSRAGARYLALNPSATNQQLFAAATYGIAGISTDPAVLTVVADPADPSLRLTGTRVAVAVTYDFRPVVPLGRLVNLLAGSGGGAAPGDQFTLTSAAASFVE